MREEERERKRQCSVKCSLLLLPGSVAKKPKLRSLVQHNVEPPPYLHFPPASMPLPFAVAFWPGVALINVDAVATAFAVVSEFAAASKKVFRFAFLLFRLLRHS